MELKPGYKLTDIGPVPDEWNIGTLDRFWNVVDCKHVTADFVATGVPVVSIREVQSRFVELEHAKQTTDLFYARLIEGGRKPSPGDLIFSRNATVGEVAQVADWHAPFAMGQDVSLLRRKSADYATDYLQSVIRSQLVTNQLENMMVGSTFRRVNVRQIKSLVVPMPPPAEQRAIAGALSDVDALIGALDQLLAKKRDLKQAAMQQLLTGHQRLPGFAPANPRFQQTDAGLIPNDWEASTVGREFDIQLGKMLDAEKNTGVLKRYLGNRAVQWDRIDTSELPMIAMSKSDLERFRLQQGDLLVCEGGEVGRAAVWDSPLEECYFQKALHRLRPRRGFNSRLMVAFLRLMSERGQLLNYVTQTSIAHLPKDKFVTVPLPVPTLAEQTAIAEVLSDMDAELAALEQKRDKTRLLKQGMMQELLTGRTRLI